MAVVSLDGVKSGMCKSQSWNIVLASLLFHFHGWGEKKGASPHHKILQQTSLTGLDRENNTKILTLPCPPKAPPSPSFFSSLFVSCFWVKRIFLGTVTSSRFELGICMLQRKRLDHPYLICPNMISVRLWNITSLSLGASRQEHF